jgi:D-amino peptidase
MILYIFYGNFFEIDLLFILKEGAQMKIYICVDMEGVCGIMRPEQTAKGNKEYEEARYLLVREVNAAIQGAFDGGADEVIVADVHGSGFNLPLEELHYEAKFVMGANASIRFPFLDTSIDLAFLVGYHAMAGTEGAVLDHTYSLDVDKIVVNGIEMGEIEIDALRCGYYNVPVALVTGDDKACGEARRYLGDIETAVVKFGICRHGALNYSPKKSREIIQAAACNAVKRAGTFKPYRLDPPYTIEVYYTTTSGADTVYVNGTDRIRFGPKKVIFKTENLLDLFITNP